MFNPQGGRLKAPLHKGSLEAYTLCKFKYEVFYFPKKTSKFEILMRETLYLKTSNFIFYIFVCILVHTIIYHIYNY